MLPQQVKSVMPVSSKRVNKKVLNHVKYRYYES
jgi:hypothetical protein